MARGPLAQDPAFRTVHAPPRFPSATSSPVRCRAVTLRGQAVGYLWAATTDDAAGFVVRKAAGADAFNASVEWAERLCRVKANGLTPLQALRHWTGDDEDPKAGTLTDQEEEHPTLAARPRPGRALAGPPHPPPLTPPLTWPRLFVRVCGARGRSPARHSRKWRGGKGRLEAECTATPPTFTPKRSVMLSSR